MPNEVDLLIEDMAMKLASAETNASLWRARAIAAGWGQQGEAPSEGE